MIHLVLLPPKIKSSVAGTFGPLGLLSSAIAAASLLGALSANAFAVEPTDPTLADITNFRQYSATFASSGQPTKDQFSAIAENGFERIVYIAFTNNPNALPDADQVVKGLGMEYMHIPVTWDNPLPSDFYAFADSLRRDTDKKTLLGAKENTSGKKEIKLNP